MDRKIVDNIKLYFYAFIIFVFSILFLYLLFFFGKNIYWSLFFMFIVYLGISKLANFKRTILIIILFFIIAIPICLWFCDYRFANFIALSLLFYIILYIPICLFENKLVLYKHKYFKYVFIFLSLIFLIGGFFINYDKTVDVIERISNGEGYYSEIPYVLYGGDLVRNNVSVFIDSPQNNQRIRGVFLIEGWAADLSDIPNSNIDKIYVFLDEKPYQGGKFLGEVDAKTRRVDLAETFGEEYQDSGFFFDIFSSKYNNGWHNIYVFAQSNYFGWKYDKVKLYFDN